MDNLLGKIVDLVSNNLSGTQEGVYVLQFTPTEDQKQLLIALKAADSIEEISCDDNVVDADEIAVGSSVKVEVVHYNLQQFGYYHDVEALISDNEFSAPPSFYVLDLQYLHPSVAESNFIDAYFAIIGLINCMSSLALFQSEENGKTLYLMQDKSAVAFPVSYDKNLIETHHPILDKINTFVSDINGHSERKKIYTKELIDFVNEEKDENQRFSYLYKHFDEFYQKCEAAYAFFLSDFSYSKLKLELESAILDYSKNIRAIINDSQTKLIAIPAAFIVASSQLNLEDALALKNLLIVISSFVFSILIEIFIKNQESSLKIFLDNINSYKTTFRLKNEGVAAKEMKTLQSIISKSFKAIDEELNNQQTRLNWIRIINWGMSLFLMLLIFGLSMYIKGKVLLLVVSTIYLMVAIIINRHLLLG